jgi:hypothetical protein
MTTDRKWDAGRESPAHSRFSALLSLLLLLSTPALFSRAGSPDRRSERAVAALRIDPNTAREEELMLLPGIGPILAANIVECRENAPVKPAFRHAEDLDSVPRIGPKTVAKLRPYLTFPFPPGDAADSHEHLE